MSMGEGGPGAGENQEVTEGVAKGWEGGVWGGRGGEEGRDGESGRRQVRQQDR